MKLSCVRSTRTSGTSPATPKIHPLDSEGFPILKGHAFSRAENVAKTNGDLAPGGKSRFLQPCALAALVATLALPCLAQTPPAQQQAPSPPPPAQPSPAPQQPSNPNSHVIFSRSTDENGQTTTTGPTAEPSTAAAVAPVATDAEREAVTFTAYDLDVHLEPAHQSIAVRAQLTVRNDGVAPLAHIPLQISSSLDWEHIRIGDREAEFTTATLNSDADHTGQLHEAAVTLATPLAPGASLTLTVSYSGAIALSAQRLLALGTPGSVALHSDWDQIDLDFTGLRGFGNVVWVPVASVPAVLGISQAAVGMTWQPAGPARVDSARLFDEIGQLKLRGQSATFKLRLTDEFPLGHAPTVALINGIPAPLRILAPPAASGETSGFATANIEEDALGFNAPSLFVAIRTPAPIEDGKLWTLPQDASDVANWLAAATAVTPLLKDWLGDHPRAPLTILYLPDPGDAPFETGALLATPMRTPNSASPANSDVATTSLETILVHTLTHAWLQSANHDSAGHARPAWLDEGIARFMGTLWIEKQQGRTRALESLEADRQALALAEPSSPGDNPGPGQPLAQAYSPAFYRTKAAYVFWMLRGLAGDTALSAAFRASIASGNGAAGNSAPNNSAAAGDNAQAVPFEKFLESSSGRDLRWFFADWVDADKGLPELAIDRVVTAPAQNGETLVAVTLSNSGYASAQIPVTVRTRQTSITQHILIPARGSLIRRILIQGAPTQVQANDGTIPETSATIHITNVNGAP